MIGRFFPVLAALTLSAGTVSAQISVTRDSAGVRIIENAARREAGIVFRLGAEALIDVGGRKTNPDDELDPRAPLFTLRTSVGGLVVADASSLVFFDMLGTRRRTVGREGDGAQEFGYISSICGLPGDTTAVFTGGRLVLVDRAGTIGRTVAPESGGTVLPNACLADGTVLLQSRSVVVGEPVRIRVDRIRTDGSRVNTVAELVFAPFDRVTTVPPSVTASGQRIYVSGGEANEVRVYSPDGKLLQIVRSADPPVPASAEEQEDALRAIVPRDASDPEARLERLRALPHRTVLPGYRRALVDPAGTLWIQDYVRDPLADETWTAFDSEGRMIGRLVLPGSLSDGALQAFLPDAVIFKRMDNFGFAHVTVFPLERIAPPN